MIQIKKTVKAGNSSAVILPRDWLNKEVRVELIKKTNDKILHEVIDIIKNHRGLQNIIGIYLTGSYARNEEDENSDIDILIITDNVDRKIIKEGIYNILIISQELMMQKLQDDLFPIGQMLKEAKPMINKYYLNSINIKVTKRNVKWYLETAEDKLKMIREAIEIARKKDLRYLPSRVAYTIILRIRTLHIILKLLKNKSYSKKEFLKIIKSIGGEKAYEEYLAVKNNSKEKGIAIDETERLYKYLNNELIKVKQTLSKT